MDNLRGHFPESDGTADDRDFVDDEAGHELPPEAIGQDERRMQVRAYNFWASLLDNRNFPSIEDLEPDQLPDFGPYSVLLDFSSGIENPAIHYLGDKIAEECGTGREIEYLADVPSRSLLSRITDHYMQIIANQAPIGFEAEFVNQRGCTILYRGILLPFSSDDDTIDFIYGVINWKELADQQTTDELLLEIDQALEAKPAFPRSDMLAEWADGPADAGHDNDDILDLTSPIEAGPDDSGMPEPRFGSLLPPAPEPAAETQAREAFAGPVASSQAGNFLDGFDDDCDDDFGDTQSMGLADWLASARELAQAARGSEERSRQALYAAIGRAYDFSIAAAAEPEEYRELIADAGLTMQDRAPMTPLVKLVFGADYDKTRITEYATAIGHAQRLGLERGSFADHLAAIDGGLKGVVATERRLRRQESGRPVIQRETPRETIARKLRRLDPAPLDAVSAEGSEFTLLLARRMPDGQVLLLGEVDDDITLIERAARRII